MSKPVNSQALVLAGFLWRSRGTDRQRYSAQLLFKEELRTERARVLFGVCLYRACRIAEACSLMVKDIYTNSGTVGCTINFRKGDTKGKLETRTLLLIEDCQVSSPLGDKMLTRPIYCPVATAVIIGNTFTKIQPSPLLAKLIKELASREHHLTASAARP